MEVMINSMKTEINDINWHHPYYVVKAGRKCAKLLSLM